MAGLLSRLKEALVKTSSKISAGIEELFIKKRLDNSTLEELEELLISADVGVSTAKEVIAILHKKKFGKEVTAEEIKQDLANILTSMFEKQPSEFIIKQDELNIILVCGVNGNGKTTTIGKMSSIYVNRGKKVAIAACDTFRAAAVSQVEVWAHRSGAELYKGEKDADPASVAHKAVINAIKSGIDILFIDTAGRLHNKKNLMDELAKIIRVIKKIKDSTTSHTLLVVDGTTGQNAFFQTEQFKEIAEISGLVITKLDGTAKAGVVLGITKKFKLPVYFIGIGESIDDLKSFVAEDFSKAIVGLE